MIAALAQPGLLAPAPLAPAALPAAALTWARDVDLFLFHLLNRTLHNGVLDAVLPALTDYIKYPVGRALAAGVWLFLLLGCGRNGRIAALLIVPTVALGDQLSSSVIKHLVDRPRPCHTLPDVRLLVHCGLGFSFPATHAVNNFAWALVVSYYLPRWAWGAFPFAALVAFSRVYVGVHYPSDVLGGAVFGLLCASLVLWVYGGVERRVRRRRAPRSGRTGAAG